MRRLLTLAVLVTVTSVSYAQNKITTVNIKASIYCDHCKRCESCGSRLEKAVYTLKGIKRVEVNEKEKTLKVTYNAQKTTPEDIRQAIAKVGFDADDVKGDPAAYEQLDECCKKQ